MKKGLILPNKILIKENKLEEKKTSTGLILPETRKNPQVSAKVILTGSLVDTIEEGMTVLYTPLSATRFLIDEEEVAILPETSVLFAYWE